MTTSASAPPLTARRALFILVMYLAAQLVAGIAVGVPLGIYLAFGAGGLGPAGTATVRRLTTIVSTLFGQLAGGVVAWRLATAGAPTGAALARFGWARPSLGAVVAGGLLGLALSGAYQFGMLVRFPPAPGHAWGPFASAALTAGWPRFLWALTALLVAPAVEELVFRGVLLAGFTASLGRLGAATLVTVLFAAAHSMEALAYWPALVMVAVVGAAAVTVRLTANSLLPAIALHVAYNLGIVAAVYNVIG